MSDSRSNITLHEGDIRDVTFQLRRLGSRIAYDVTGAVLRLRVSRLDLPANDAVDPYIADSLHTGADFASGKVVVTVDRRVTQLTGTYQYALEIEQTDGQKFVLQTGKLEVKKLPGSKQKWFLGIIDVRVNMTGAMNVT